MFLAATGFLFLSLSLSSLSSHSRARGIPPGEGHPLLAASAREYIAAAAAAAAFPRDLRAVSRLTARYGMMKLNICAGEALPPGEDNWIAEV